MLSVKAREASDTHC